MSEDPSWLFDLHIFAPGDPWPSFSIVGCNASRQGFDPFPLDADMHACWHAVLMTFGLPTRLLSASIRPVAGLPEGPGCGALAVFRVERWAALEGGGDEWIPETVSALFDDKAGHVYIASGDRTPR